MEAFCEARAADGQSVAIGRHLLYGYLKLRARNKVLEAGAFDSVKQAIKGWTRVVKDKIRDPAPEELIFLLALTLDLAGFTLSARACLPV